VLQPLGDGVCPFSRGVQGRGDCGIHRGLGQPGQPVGVGSHPGRDTLAPIARNQILDGFGGCFVACQQGCQGCLVRLTDRGHMGI
jgi:hypothetical protein